MVKDWPFVIGSDHRHAFEPFKKKLQCRLCGLITTPPKGWWAKYGRFPSRARPQCLCCTLPSMEYGRLCETCIETGGIPVFERGMLFARQT